MISGLNVIYTGISTKGKDKKSENAGRMQENAGQAVENAGRMQENSVALMKNFSLKLWLFTQRTSV